MVHCTNVELSVRAVPTLQIDLSRDITVVFADEESRPKIVNATNQNLACMSSARPGVKENIATGPFGEQIVTFFHRSAEGEWEMGQIDSTNIKSEGYIELAGVSGSTVDLAGLEEETKK